jgi:hypothetical protein
MLCTQFLWKLFLVHTTPPGTSSSCSLFSSSDLRAELQRKGILYVTSANPHLGPDIWSAMEMVLPKLHFRLYQSGDTQIYCVCVCVSHLGTEIQQRSLT